MKIKPSPWFFTLCVTLALVSASFPTAPAEEQVVDRTGAIAPLLVAEDQAAQDDESASGLVPYIVERISRRARNIYPGDEGRNHTVVKAAFRDVVADANQSTVQVLASDKHVALGTVVSADGYILTKASELSGRITVKLADGSRREAELIKTDDTTDLALLRIDADNLTPVRWANADAPLVGSFLATAGAKNEPLAIGVVSVAPRKIPAPGGVLGIAVGQAETGARVDQVLEGSSAARAGLRVNDIIARINDRDIDSRDALISVVGAFRPGDRVQLVVIRGEEKLSISTTLGSRSFSRRRDFQNRLGGELSERRGGFEQVLQHDTVLRPRDCGGPVVDLDGNVVGINIARAERVASYALPASVVIDVLDRMTGSVAQKGQPSGATQARRVSTSRTAKK
jgi:serine protease Do